ncbi:MAG TPA: CCA tRNA nucleotidyltransferase [Frankiaceae bacterium]|nr:CCA tRNA nucleotidyltransferase [Frankiaceae bacterium]
MSRLSEVQRSAVAELLRIAPVADDLGRRFAEAGHRLYLVGGSVRDALLGRLGDDLDFATDALPEQVLALVDEWGTTWETGRAFGTIGVARGPVRCEITTFRGESYDPASRKPDVVYGDSLDEDLRRRDFTVNAMAVALPDHEFVDPFDGLADLARGVLRTPGTPEESFTDDPLRMMRAARFAAQLGFAPDPGVVAAMAAMADRIQIVSAERVQVELSKTLLGKEPVRGLTLLVDTGLCEHVLPELPAMRLAIDAVHRHKDVYLHSLAVLENAISREAGEPDLTLRLAALLHDIGKPATREIGPDGVSFHHHEVVGAKLARKRLKALKYPKQLTEDVCRLIELHLRFHTYRMGWTDSAVRRYVADAGPLLPRLNVLVRSDCTTRNVRKAQQLAAAYDSLEERIAALLEAEELARIRPDLDGREIMEILGIPPGPAVGKAYQYLLDQRMERGPIPHDEAVALLQEWARSSL